MLDAEDKKYIKQEIQKHINIILSGISSGNTIVDNENIGQLFPGMPNITERPVMHPYGYASRSVNDVIQVTGKQGEHVGNRIILGHRDKNRPKDLAQGESVVYSNGGLKIYLRNNRIQITSENADNPAVLYRELLALLESILTHIINHTHTGNMGLETSTPLNFSDFESDIDQIPTIQSLKVFLETVTE